MRVAAEATHYALLTAPDLLAAARLAMETPDAPVLAALRHRFATTDGLVAAADLLGEG